MDCSLCPFQPFSSSLLAQARLQTITESFQKLVAKTQELRCLFSIQGFSVGEVLQDEVTLDGVSVMKQGWGDSCWQGGHAAVLWTA